MRNLQSRIGVFSGHPPNTSENIHTVRNITAQTHDFGRKALPNPIVLCQFQVLAVERT
jgi:hypothetical protein